MYKGSEWHGNCFNVELSEKNGLFKRWCYVDKAKRLAMRSCTKGDQIGLKISIEWFDYSCYMGTSQPFVQWS